MVSFQRTPTYQGPNGSSGYDADGDVVAYQYRDNTGRVDQYQVTYLKKDGYLQATTGGVNISDTPNVQPSTSQSVYDTRGDLVALEQHMEDPYGTVEDTVHVFAYDGNGEIIERRDGTGDGATLNQGSTPTKENQHYVYVDGQQVAHYDDAGTLDVLDEVTAFSSNNDSPDSYVVQAGDTLESIAQTQYGNSNLWYVIAQANDVAGDSDLALGQRLTIPTVTTHANSSTTFAPYDPGSIVGSTSPTLPTIAPPPPAPPGGCSTAEILVIVVTVVATIVTEGATSELLAEEFAGMSAVESGAIAGAAAGAAGSVAGQLTAQAEGLQNGFNWGQVAESAIGGAIGGAGTSELSSTNTFGGSSANGLSGWGNAVEGAVGYAGNDLAAELTGQQEHFSWAGLVAASLSSVASGALGPTNEQSQIGLTTGNYVDDVSARAVGDVVDREVSVALGDQHVPSWVQVGENVAGNAIGQPIGTYLSGLAVNAIKSYEAQKAQARLQSLQDGLIAMSASVNANLDKQYDNQVETQFQQKMAQAIAQGSQTLSGQIDEYVDNKLQSAVDDYFANSPNSPTDSADNTSPPAEGTGSVILPDGVILSGEGEGPVQYAFDPYAKDNLDKNAFSNGTLSSNTSPESTANSAASIPAPYVVGNVQDENGRIGYVYNTGVQVYSVDENVAPYVNNSDESGDTNNAGTPGPAGLTDAEMLRMDSIPGSPQYIRALRQIVIEGYLSPNLAKIGEAKEAELELRGYGANTNPTGVPLAQLIKMNQQSGTLQLTAQSVPQANDMIRAALGLSPGTPLLTNQIVNISQPNGTTDSGYLTTNVNQTDQLNYARAAFAGDDATPVASIVVTNSAFLGYMEVSGVQATLDSDEITDDKIDYANSHSPETSVPKDNEEVVSGMNAVEQLPSLNHNIITASDAALNYRFDIYESDIDPTNMKVEVTAYYLDSQNNVVGYHPYYEQAAHLINQNQSYLK